MGQRAVDMSLMAEETCAQYLGDAGGWRDQLAEATPETAPSMRAIRASRSVTRKWDVPDAPTGCPRWPAASGGATRGLPFAVVGINHRSVPLPVLEPMIVAPSDLPKALADLSGRACLDEVVVLSTCMRTEVYASVSRARGAMAEIREFFSAWSGQPQENFSDQLYSHFGATAVRYLFRVASGLDSAALGEPEVLGQVRHAWDVAVNEGTSGPLLSSAFRHAVQVGKRARAETNISRGTTSLPYAALDLVVSRAGGLAGSQVLIVGLGEVGETAAKAFSNLGAGPSGRTC